MHGARRVAGAGRRGARRAAAAGGGRWGPHSKWLGCSIFPCGRNATVRRGRGGHMALGLGVGGVGCAMGGWLCGFLRMAGGGVPGEHWSVQDRKHTHLNYLINQLQCTYGVMIVVVVAGRESFLIIRTNVKRARKPQSSKYISRGPRSGEARAPQPARASRTQTDPIQPRAELHQLGLDRLVDLAEVLDVRFAVLRLVLNQRLPHARDTRTKNTHRQPLSLSASQPLSLSASHPLSTPRQVTNHGRAHYCTRGFRLARQTSGPARPLPSHRRLTCKNGSASCVAATAPPTKISTSGL